MKNLTIAYTAEQLLEKSKEELQTLYAEILGADPKAKDTKQQLTDAILEKQAENAGQPLPGGENGQASTGTNPAPELTGDDKIIAENPDADPYLLLEKGLSQEGFEKLMMAGTQGGITQPAAKPTMDGGEPETKAVETNYEKTIQPAAKASTLIADKRAGMQGGDDEDGTGGPQKPTLIGKVTQLPGKTVAQSMAASTSSAKGKKNSVNLAKHTVKTGGVQIQKGNGQPEIVSRATAERLMRLDPGVYKILS